MVKVLGTFHCSRVGRAALQVLPKAVGESADWYLPPVVGRSNPRCPIFRVPNGVLELPTTFILCRRNRSEVLRLSHQLTATDIAQSN